jgi:uncharacterized protein YegJ (DUF2314 family)
MKPVLALLVAVVLFAGCSKPKMPETLVSEFDEAAMDAAIATAQRRVDEFLSVLQAGGADSYSVKAPVKDGENTEHFWVVNVTYRDGVFSGEIGNEPGIVKNVTLGQTWEIKKEDISDWMYVKAGRIHGGFTIDPLLPTFPKEEAEALREKLVR